MDSGRAQPEASGKVGVKVLQVLRGEHRFSRKHCDDIGSYKDTQETANHILEELMALD